MKKILFFLLPTFAILTGCVKAPLSDKPSDDAFNWTTITSKTITLAETSDVINQDGDTVAKNLPAGTYDLNVGPDTELSAVPVIATKAGSATRSSVTFPASGKYATIMVEDIYPYRGDYDFNDIAFGLRIEYIMDKGGRNVNTIKFSVLPAGAGSQFDKLGIGVYLTGAAISPSSRATGMPDDVSELFPSLYAGGVEYCDEGLVLPLTGNIRKHFMKKGADGSYALTNETYTSMVNTENNREYYKGEPITVTLPIAKAPYSSIALFGTDTNKSILDVFVMIGERGKEIHLKGMKPTSHNTIVNKNVVNYEQDGYVWMVVTDSPAHYPIEYTSVEKAYPNFTKWVKSHGQNHAKWYNNPSNPELIYAHTAED